MGICRHEHCQVLENGCLASSHNQVLFLFLVYLNYNGGGGGQAKGANLCCHPFFFWQLQKTGLEEKSKFKFKLSVLACASGQIL